VISWNRAASTDIYLPIGASDRPSTSITRTPTMSSFKDKVVIVTGASSGIGAVAAVHLASLGGLLVIVGRNVEKLRETADKIVAVGGAPALELQADMTKEAEVQQIVDATLAKYGRIDVLVNNAGILESGSIENTSLEQFDRLMNTNVRKVVGFDFIVPILNTFQGIV